MQIATPSVRLGFPENKENQEYTAVPSEEVTMYLHHSVEEVKPAYLEIGLAKFLFLKRLVLRNLLE